MKATMHFVKNINRGDILKKPIHVKTICIAAMAVILFVVAGTWIFLKVRDPERIVTRKHAGNPGYGIQLQKSNGPYTCFLGKDEKNVYLDLFRGSEYFGTNERQINGTEPIGVYQFGQYDTLAVVWGSNIDPNYRSYSLEVGSTATEPMKAEKEIKDDKYILDIYVLDVKYNGTADLELMK